MRGERHVAARTLVELAHGLLDGAAGEAARLHLVTCARCSSELAVLRGEGEAAARDAAAPLIALVPSSAPGARRIAAAAAGEDALPDPATGAFLCRFDALDLELYGFERADGYRLALYYADRASLGAVRCGDLVEERAFPTGWVGRLRRVPDGTRVAIEYAGATVEVTLVRARGEG